MRVYLCRNINDQLTHQRSCQRRPFESRRDPIRKHSCAIKRWKTIMCNAASGSQRTSKPPRVSLSLDKRLQAAQTSQKFPTFVSSLARGLSSVLERSQHFSKPIRDSQNLSTPSRVCPNLPRVPRSFQDSPEHL